MPSHKLDHYMLEMEERLAADQENAYRYSLLGELDSWHAELIQVLKAGVSPDEFKQVDGLREAVEQAAHVVSTVEVPSLNKA